MTDPLDTQDYWTRLFNDTAQPPLFDAAIHARGKALLEEFVSDAGRVTVPMMKELLRAGDDFSIDQAVLDHLSDQLHDRHVEKVAQGVATGKVRPDTKAPAMAQFKKITRS